MTPPELNNQPMLPPELDAWYDSAKPWEAGFISVMRAIAALTPDLPPPGQAERPAQERFRLGQVSSMTFSPREISAISLQNEKLSCSCMASGFGAHRAQCLFTFLNWPIPVTSSMTTR